MELNPVTRKETFLAAAAGQDVTTPTPITREEVFLDAIAKSGGGGSSGGGALVVHMVYDEEKDNDYTDKTWKEIYDAPTAVIVEDTALSGRTIKTTSPVVAVEHNGSEYSVSYYAYSPIGGEITANKIVTDSENGYLTWA